MYVNYFKLVYYVIPALQFLHEIQNPIPTINFKKNIIFYNLLKLFRSYFKAQNQWKHSTYSLHSYVRVVYIEKERFYAVTKFTPREK